MSKVRRAVLEALEMIPGFRVVVSNEDYMIFKIGSKSFGVDVDRGFNITLVNHEVIMNFENLDLMMLELLSWL